MSTKSSYELWIHRRRRRWVPSVAVDPPVWAMGRVQVVSAQRRRYITCTALRWWRRRPGACVFRRERAVTRLERPRGMLHTHKVCAQALDVALHPAQVFVLDGHAHGYAHAGVRVSVTGS
jgi:hypothetical protein